MDLEDNFIGDKRRTPRTTYYKYALVFVLGFVACVAFYNSSSPAAPLENIVDPMSLATYYGCSMLTSKCWTWCLKGLTTYGWCYSTNSTSAWSSSYVGCNADTDCNQSWKCSGSWRTERYSNDFPPAPSGGVFSRFLREVARETSWRGAD